MGKNKFGKNKKKAGNAAGDAMDVDGSGQTPRNQQKINKKQMKKQHKQQAKKNKTLPDPRDDFVIPTAGEFFSPGRCPRFPQGRQR